MPVATSMRTRNQGYAATNGGDLVRPGLAHQALRLGRMLAGLMFKDAPESAEVLGLLALMKTWAIAHRMDLARPGRTGTMNNRPLREAARRRVLAAMAPRGGHTFPVPGWRSRGGAPT